MKRFIDIFLAFGGFLFLLPLLICISFTIFVVNGRPIFFCQRRVGKNGRRFEIYKFRTMTNVPITPAASVFTAGDCSRVTTIGRILRKWKLDELPQLVNVAKGDMSIVGPRPETEDMILLYPELWKEILSIRPGITDPASIKFRDEEMILKCAENPLFEYKTVILPQKLQENLNYVRNRTLSGDLLIIIHTLSVLLRHSR